MSPARATSGNSASRGRLLAEGALTLLAAGGTGGHLFPAEALARALLARGRRVALVTDRRGEGFASLPEVPVHRIAAASPSGSLARRASGLLSLTRGYFEARSLVARLEPALTVGFGGYPSVPTALAARHLGIAVALHEQNALLGRANRLLAGKARLIATAFPEVRGLPPAAHPVLVGNPVRAAVVALAGRPYPAPAESGAIALLVTGGSQGALAFNTAVPAALAALPEALRRRVAVSQQVRGADALESVAAAYAAAGIEAELKPFFADLPQRLATAQLLICRAGASTIAELTTAGRPAILVPYPHAADDHQRANAASLEKAGAAWLLEQDTLGDGSLTALLCELLDAPERLAAAAAAARALGRPQAAEHFADLLCAAGNGANGKGATGRDEPEREAAA